MAHTYTTNTLPTVLVGTDFITPTERYLSTHPLANIKPYLKNFGVTSNHVTALNEAISNETIGFFGYHGSSREFRIYQDIIRFSIEEVLGISIRPDFQFMRIPGDPNLNTDSVYEYFAMQSDEEQNPIINESHLFLAMNMALYEQYYYYEQCSIYEFAHNNSKYNFEKKIIPFFALLGIDPSYIHKAFEIGRSKLTNSGVLLQFFDISNYELIDQQTYNSLSTGKRYFQNYTTSQFILNMEQTAFPQFRLLLNNHHTLNPNSSLVIKRYDLSSSYNKDFYEQELRKYLKKLPANEVQKEIYKAELLSRWK